MGDEAVASLSKLVEDLTTKVANLTDSNADLQGKITHKKNFYKKLNYWVENGNFTQLLS